MKNNISSLFHYKHFDINVYQLYSFEYTMYPYATLTMRHTGLRAIISKDCLSHTMPYQRSVPSQYLHVGLEALP